MVDIVMDKLENNGDLETIATHDDSHDMWLLQCVREIKRKRQREREREREREMGGEQKSSYHDYFSPVT